MVTQKVQFGELETKALFALEEAEARVITSAQLAQILRISKNRANKLAWQLALKKRLIRIRKGTYLFAPLKAGPKGHWSEESLVILSELLKNAEYSVSYWAALNHYGLTEQIPWTVQVLVTKRRRRSFLAAGSKFEFIKVNRIGEWRYEQIAGKNVRITTVEQLIIDCLAHPEYCGGIKEAAKALWTGRKRLKWTKLKELAQNSKNVVQRRLGLLLDLLQLPRIKPEKKYIGWRWLDSSSVKTTKGKSTKWGLLLNLNEKELTEWKEN